VSFRFAGAGPGVQARDGCSVELYRKLPYLGELEGYRALFPADAQVLELGCGAGRLTRRLLEWGTRVAAVDNCPEMLAAVPEAALRVLSDIESLNLDRRFDVALLASCLINHPAPDIRFAFVATARRHLGRRGCLLLERHDPSWLRAVQPGPIGPVGDIAMSVEAARRTGDVVEMTLRYEIAGDTWRHSSAVSALNEAEIEALLSQSGLGSFVWSGARNRWLSAVVE
jgi:SAM-dependent methyltransferase